MSQDTQHTAIVTGASKGIGKATALGLAQDGFFVFVNYLSDEPAARRVVDQIRDNGGNADLLPFDVCSSSQCLDAVKSAVKTGKPIDVLINNAGLRRDKLLGMMKKEAWDDVIQTNLTGFYHLTKPVVKQMLKNRYGRIVNVSSTAGLLGNGGQVNYSASKAGLIGATKALAREIANRNITVNAVAPGFIETRMLEGINPEQILDTIPAGRLGTPEEVAHVIRFLCSKNAAYVNGQVIGVNGGMI